MDIRRQMGDGGNRSAGKGKGFSKRQWIFKIKHMVIGQLKLKLQNIYLGSKIKLCKCQQTLQNSGGYLGRRICIDWRRQEFFSAQSAQEVGQGRVWSRLRFRFRVCFNLRMPQTALLFDCIFPLYPSSYSKLICKKENGKLFEIG